jgi:hypothetical protein
MDITIISYNTKTFEFQYASAGGEFALCQKNTIKLYKGNNYPIGGWQIEKNRKFDTFKVDLNMNAKLYFFSDGFKHQFNWEDTKKFTRKKLLDLIFHYHTFSMDYQKEFIDFIFTTWKRWDSTNRWREFGWNRILKLNVKLLLSRSEYSLNQFNIIVMLY